MQKRHQGKKHRQIAGHLLCQETVPSRDTRLIPALTGKRLMNLALYTSGPEMCATVMLPDGCQSVTAAACCALYAEEGTAAEGCRFLKGRTVDCKKIFLLGCNRLRRMPKQ